MAGYKRTAEQAKADRQLVVEMRYKLMSFQKITDHLNSLPGRTYTLTVGQIQQDYATGMRGQTKIIDQPQNILAPIVESELDHINELKAIKEEANSVPEKVQAMREIGQAHARLINASVSLIKHGKKEDTERLNEARIVIEPLAAAPPIESTPELPNEAGGL